MSTKLKLDRLPSPIRHHLQSMFSSCSPRSSAPTWLCVVLNFNTRKGICGSLGAWTQSRLGYHTKSRWECMLNYPYTGVIPSNPYAFFLFVPFLKTLPQKSLNRWKPIGVIGSTFSSGKNWLVQIHALLDGNESFNFCKHKECVLLF